jgi:hypothetical protein
MPINRAFSPIGQHNCPIGHMQKHQKAAIASEKYLKNQKRKKIIQLLNFNFYYSLFIEIKLLLT